MADATRCWVVTDGKAGMVNQCIGLAEALGLKPEVKRVRLRPPWDWVAPHVSWRKRDAFTEDSGVLDAPFPDLLIATGRHSVLASRHVREASAKERPGRATITVQIQNPVISPKHFDLVIAPRHDRLTGDNVVATFGALHRVTSAALMEGAGYLAPLLGGMPRPYIGVLIGGANAAYRFTPEVARALGLQLAALSRSMRASLLITPSRRTGEANIAAVRSALADVPHFFWDGEGINPYFGILALSNVVVVTPDSVNMISEAVAAGKPTYVLDLPGGSEKFERFLRIMEGAGFIRRFAGSLSSYDYERPKDMQTAAERVKALLAARAPAA